MSSDNPPAAGLFADYKISWKQLFNKLIHFFLSELVSVVGLSDDKEIAVIEGKGCILGEVSSVKRNATWEDRQDVAITWRNAPSYICVKEAWGFLLDPPDHGKIRPKRRCRLPSSRSVETYDPQAIQRSLGSYNDCSFPSGRFTSYDRRYQVVRTFTVDNSLFTQFSTYLGLGYRSRQAAR
ncbi:hypothetical protein B0H65DRAFT_543257 [Neurospora tetraspora]|uniref:Uncharacterized protein n=1 Tax=Neurospora tetraspora TaxID=94610 RepID=A0AAE0J0C8_9PEZI|nr:hypothetical protein B0H65DRAFT_543257 [Neurospora tetraspora]